MALELTTTALIQSELNDTSLSASLLATYANAAEDQIANYCNRRDDAAGAHWLTASRTEYIRVSYAEALILRWSPVTAITSVSTVESATSATALTLADLEVDGLPITGTFTAGAGIVKWRNNPRSLWLSGYDRPPVTPSIRWPNFGRGLIKVVYTGGYAAAPPALILVATQLAALMYRLRSVNLALQSETLGKYSYTRAFTRTSGEASDPFSPIRSALEPYVRQGVNG